jgi:hypothetical protein
MRYRLLGNTGLRVSEVFLGTMTFGEQGGVDASPDECRSMVDAYASAGGNVIDTAINYRGGASEAIVGELIEKRRDRFVVSTKYTVTRCQSLALCTRSSAPAASSSSSITSGRSTLRYRPNRLSVSSRRPGSRLDFRPTSLPARQAGCLAPRISALTAPVADYGPNMRSARDVAERLLS